MGGLGVMVTYTPNKQVSSDIAAILNTVTKHLVIPADAFGKNPTNPPAIGIYGICQSNEFTVNTDKAYYKIHVPDDWIPGTDILLYIHWTRSTTGSNDSGKTVKWQLKYLAVNGTSENVNSGETTLSVQDTYDSSDVNQQVAYCTDPLTIAAAAIEAGDCITLELMAITPTGTALSEPACVGFSILWTANQVIS
jgi:hypothetical protein